MIDKKMMEEQAIMWQEEKAKHDHEMKNQTEQHKKELEDNAKFL